MIGLISNLLRNYRYNKEVQKSFTYVEGGDVDYIEKWLKLKQQQMFKSICSNQLVDPNSTIKSSTDFVNLNGE